ncbi:diaminobutyrate--2-oxoglutarate transaminase [Aureibacillus halotolerans]|uniref:Diaminobutyrate--2-oxoglutarate transaminase n=1 Tax=Aureibacillus halotolerans TaxID=1508390 RepID=A0A4V3D4F5_9BACI|nr:diaminobutyrate--2-oxoglutarate transaminase [Aureibacillus halotolerans]TDQ35418.1 diaminobutyrate aminotransferase [Aureibacillus halotolerans]
MKTESTNPMGILEENESQVRSYSRSFPTIFKKAKGHTIWDADGNAYIDFFAGAGALNYGHNHDEMKKVLIDYLQNDYISHSLDMGTEARVDFLQTFKKVVLEPRNLDYKVMFPGPTGANTVESALKIARKVTGRELVISFTNAFHGMTIGALSVTANSFKRHGAGMPLSNTVSMPFDDYIEDSCSLAYLEKYLEDKGSGVALPAAIILETVQGEGGINAASKEWLQGVEKLCRQYDILLIVDDVQAGCGRTGTFFSFEPSGIKPDVVCLSKSIGGYGLPLALTLIKPEYDQWGPGEHNGTFRGNNLAIVAASKALKTFWSNDTFQKNVQGKSVVISETLQSFAENYPELKAEARGRGFMQGIACGVEGIAEKICEEAFSRGVIMETSGPQSEVAKLLPPLTITEEALVQGLNIMEESIKAAIEKHVAS